MLSPIRRPPERGHTSDAEQAAGLLVSWGKGLRSVEASRRTPSARLRTGVRGVGEYQGRVPRERKRTSSCSYTASLPRCGIKCAAVLRQTSAGTGGMSSVPPHLFLARFSTHGRGAGSWHMTHERSANREARHRASAACISPMISPIECGGRLGDRQFGACGCRERPQMCHGHNTQAPRDETESETTDQSRLPSTA
jgi:hypothetical protein